MNHDLNGETFYKVVVRENSRWISAMAVFPVIYPQVRLSYFIGRKTVPLVSGSKIFVFRELDCSKSFLEKIFGSEIAPVFDPESKVEVVPEIFIGAAESPRPMPFQLGMPPLCSPIGCTTREMTRRLNDFWSGWKDLNLNDAWSFDKNPGSFIHLAPVGTWICDSFTPTETLFTGDSGK